MTPFQICSRDSFPLPSSISLSLSLPPPTQIGGKGISHGGGRNYDTCESFFFPFLLLPPPFFLFFSFPFLSFLFVTAQTILERRCMDIFFSERHSRILRGCEMNSRARIERATMLHVAAFLSKAHMSYVMCGVSLFS